MEDSIHLMPLRIPQGWAVVYNRFYDILPIARINGTIENWSFFTSRLLNIYVMDFKTTKVNYEETLFIDLEWNKENDANGQYYASMIYANKREDILWQEVKNFSSRDRFLIADTIAQWMEDVDITEPFTSIRGK
jgi:hypothetical protein